MAVTPNSANNDNSMQALQKHGGNIVTVILLALAGYFGWTYWQNNHARVDTVAADHYADIQRLSEEISLASQNPDLDKDAIDAVNASRAQLDQRIDALVADHGDSVYAWQALMIQAREQADNDEFDAASDTLQRALQIDLADAGLQAITQLRYAETLLAMGDLDGALSAARQELPTSFESSQQELLGDIYLAQDKQDEAIQAYNNAWEGLRERQEIRSVLALKMESLGVVPEPIDEPANLIEAASSTSDATEATEAATATVADPVDPETTS